MCDALQFSVSFVVDLEAERLVIATNPSCSPSVVVRLACEVKPVCVVEIIIIIIMNILGA